MTQVINQKSSEKYTWNEGCFGWHFINNDRLSIILEEMDSNTSEAVHFHNYSQQFFYILEGKATIILEGIHHTLDKGDGIHILPKAIHSIENNSTQKIKFLVISEPHIHNDKALIINT